MSTSLLARGAAALSAAVLVTGLATSIGHAAPDPAKAGSVTAWGVTGSGPVTLPASVTSTPIAQVEATGTDALFLTAAGDVIAQTTNVLFEPPSSLANQDVLSIAASGTTFVAVTDEGPPVFWGTGGPATDISTVDATNLTQVAVSNAHGIGIKADGSVIGWGTNTYGQAAPPPGLANVVKVAVGSGHSYALSADGTVTAWGRDNQGQVTLPSQVTVPGAVKDVEARGTGGLALLNDGTLVSWGQNATTSNAVPAGLTDVVAIRAALNANVAVTSSGAVTVWGTAPTEVPTTLDASKVSHLAIASDYGYVVQSKVMTISGSTLAGTAKQGQTLTGTPATFSGGPEVTHEWLANGTPIAGATGTTLTLGTAQVGKKISFRSIATKGAETLTSDSPLSATVAPATVPKVASKTTIAKPKVKKKTVAITVKVTRSGGTPTGKVKITVKRGSKTVYNKSVTLKKGVAKITIKKLKKGKHKVSASYAGDSRSKPSSAKAQTFKIK